jgi:hypothetical protein
MGGVHPGVGGNSLVALVRYFDADQRRPGLPADVAALVDRIKPDQFDVTLVNVNQLAPRTVTIQGGAYGEHQLVDVKAGLHGQSTNNPQFSVRLAPGAGAKLTIWYKRHVNQPTFDLPWE